MAVRAWCHCGAVMLEVDEAPTEINDCQCTVCRRYGALGAYYRPSDVRFVGDGVTDAYLWGPRKLGFYRCARCGGMTHWASVDPGRDRMGINTRMMDPEAVAGAVVRQSAWPPR